MMPRRWICACLGLLTACDASTSLVTPEPALERMLAQPRVDPYDAPMRVAPAGTVATDSAPDTAMLDAEGTYATRLPMPLTRALLRRGQRDYDAMCAVCHGYLGDGVSVVARHMPTPPETLHSAALRAYPAGRLFQVIRAGQGLMPAMYEQLDIAQSWGVVAYVQALQRSQHATLAQLPATVQQRAHQALHE